MNYVTRAQLKTDERNLYPQLSDIVAHLLFHRGFRDAATAEKFLSPDYDRDCHDPFLLKDAEKSADRIIRAIKGNERIAVYADYDADGIPGAALCDDFFKRIGFNNYVIYIPHRHDEGFGLNEEAVMELAGQGAKLIITIDCGITDVVPIERANKLGVEVIVTDHHEPPQSLPPAFAIVDHKQSDCPYPDKNLCGTGVAYKLIQAILKKDRLGLKEGHEKWFLDLVGIATMSDMVPLTGENRVFAHYGLTVLRKSPRKGIMQLLRKLRINQRNLTEDDIAFMITPRINAASRMGVPMDAFNLLAADNDDTAYACAEHLDSINNERKGVVASLVKEIKKTVHDRHGQFVPSVIVLGNPVWRPSLLGLAANSCAEEFNRPVFLWGRDGDNAIKGSCRSEGRTHVVELMRAVPAGIFSQFGGHKHSGGFAVGNDQIHFLEAKLNEAAEKMGKLVDSKNSVGQTLENDAAKNTDMIDLELSLDAVDSRLYEDVNRLAPFGVGNSKPVFLFRNVTPQSVRRFGKGNDHIELVFNKSPMAGGTSGGIGGGGGGKVSAISFFGATNEWAKKIQVNMPVDLIASVEKSMFMNKAELRLRVVEVVIL